MPLYNTQQLIHFLHDHTDAFLEKAVREWQSLPDEIFQHKVSPEKWSANQCLAHLNSYGVYYLPLIEQVIRKAIENTSMPSENFTTGWLGHYFTNMMLTKPDGTPAKKMSSPKNHHPQIQEDSHLVIATFIEQQEKMLWLLEEAKKVNPGELRIPISIAPFIRLKLGDTFLFLIAHNYRHLQQAVRALENANVHGKKLLHFDTVNI